MTTFLRFPDEATAQQVMADYYQPYVAPADGYYEGEGEEAIWHPPVAEQEAHWKTSGYWWGLDVVGIITRGVTTTSTEEVITVDEEGNETTTLVDVVTPVLDEEGNQVTETLEGWHLNFNGDLPTTTVDDEVVEFPVEYIVEPKNPARTFA